MAGARRWAPGEGLSLADRLCMALGDRLDADIWTADQAWGISERIRQVLWPGDVDPGAVVEPLVMLAE